MSRSIVLVSKFLGVATLGLLTGTSFTLNQLAVPPLLALPSLSPAFSSFTTLRRRTAALQRSLVAVSLASLTTALAFSPSRARHPYLVWMGLAAGLGLSADWLLEDGDAPKGPDRGPDGEGEGINGEMVRDGMERWKFGMAVRGAIWGLGWAMGLVGIWGDEY